jgi:hypothetical protein
MDIDIDKHYRVKFKAVYNGSSSNLAGTWEPSGWIEAHVGYDADLGGVGITLSVDGGKIGHVIGFNEDDGDSIEGAVYDLVCAWYGTTDEGPGYPDEVYVYEVQYLGTVSNSLYEEV